MPFDVQEVQNQVALMTGHDGLSTRVLTWANRTLMAMATHAYWQGQITRGYAIPKAVSTQSVEDNWITNGLTTADVINIYRAENIVLNATGTAISTFKGPVVQYDIGNMYGNFLGNTLGITGSTIEKYGVVKYMMHTGTVASSKYIAPVLGIHPNFSNTITTATATGATAAGALQVFYLKAPPKLLASNSTHWIIQKYFSTFLAGVLRYARLYLGDYAGYLMEKGEYENGLRDMLLAEETAYAGIPVMHGIVPETNNRFQ